ncbi:MAG: GDSL-type esterase/lipase family protein [Candidatus Bathyarchaeota archaeon]|nr:GDSL-type esterase/lipase family protein [Candidatus Bathyarchaeota archaeon]
MNRKRKCLLAVSILLLVTALVLLAFFSGNRANESANLKLAHVACLGDSITESSGYPEYLQALLGANSVVGNFGVSGATVSFNSYKPYYFEAAFERAKRFEPTTVIIMLGTNDARTDYYQQIDNFVTDYTRIINSLQALSSKPQIFLVKPPPIFNNAYDLNGTSFVEGVLSRIEQVAKTLGLPVIDVYTPLANHPEYFPDGVHPNTEGAQIIANTVYNAITSTQP